MILLIKKYDLIIVGAGPSGLFTAYELITKNKDLKVTILDEGRVVKTRVCPMNKKGIPCQNCNPCAIMAGYGGAGTFSDGKLTTGISSPYIKKVLSYFHKFGAPKEILYLNKPHIGTDNLINIYNNPKEKEFRFESK